MYRVLELNPYLYPYADYIERRVSFYHETRRKLVPDGERLSGIADMHRYYGFHHADGGWYYREWAPSAEQIYLTGDFNCQPATSPYEAIIKSGFADSRDVAIEDISVVNGSYHAYGKKENEIDFCFFKGNEDVLQYEIISKSYISEGETEPGFVSDHYGVMATFKKEG